MKKLLLTAALLPFLAFPASAAWLTGEQNILAVNGGEAAFHVALSSGQVLDANLASAGPAADLVFTSKATKAALTLSSLPVSLSNDSDAVLTVTPLINDGNGQRFYLVTTGAAGGARIISYSKGSFKEVFSSASLAGETGAASFTAGKKELLLKFEGGGTYRLTYSAKDGAFSAAKV